MRINGPYELRKPSVRSTRSLTSSPIMDQPITEVGIAFRVPTLSTSRSDIPETEVVSPDITLDYAI